MDNYGFIELKVDEHKAETLNGEIGLYMYISNDQVMAPIVAIGDELGTEVTWYEDTNQIILEGNGHHFDVTVKDTSNNAVTFDGDKLCQYQSTCRSDGLVND